ASPLPGSRPHDAALVRPIEKIADHELVLAMRPANEPVQKHVNETAGDRGNGRVQPSVRFASVQLAHKRRKTFGTVAKESGQLTVEAGAVERGLDIAAQAAKAGAKLSCKLLVRLQAAGMLKPQALHDRSFRAGIAAEVVQERVHTAHCTTPALVLVAHHRQRPDNKFAIGMEDCLRELDSGPASVALDLPVVCAE